MTTGHALELQRFATITLCKNESKYHRQEHSINYVKLHLWPHILLHPCDT